MIYREKAETRLYDFDSDGYLTLTGMLRIMENTASHHSNTVMDELAAKQLNGFSWLLTEWHVEIIKTPSRSGGITVETWIINAESSARSIREMRLSDDEGNVLIIAEMTFAAYNINEGRVLRLTKAFLAQYRPESERLFKCSPPRLAIPKEYDAELSVPVRRGDLDFNDHVHNTVYMDYALEALPGELIKSRRVSSFRVIYHHSVKYGDPLTLRTKRTGSKWLTGMYVGGKLYCAVEVSERKEENA